MITLFFILSTLIIVNFTIYFENRSSINIVSSNNLVGKIFNFIFRLFIIEIITLLAYTTMSLCSYISIKNPSDFSLQIFFNAFFFKPNLTVIIIFSLLLIAIFYSIIISNINYAESDLEFMDLLISFIYVFYCTMHLLLKNTKKDKIIRNSLGFDTAIDDMVITSNEGKKLLSVINDDLIPKYNQLIELSKQANELESNDTLTQLEDSKEKLQTKIKKIALTIKDCELEEDREKLKKKANLLIKSLD